MLQFRYGVLGAGAFSLFSNYALFRFSSSFFQFIYFTSTMLMGHLLVNSLVNRRFNRLIEPYFEKYEIK